MNKQYVLWVVHSDLTNPADESSSRHVYAKEKLALDKRFEEFRKKFRLDKERHELHIAGIINAMKEAQELGMPIVYENLPTAGKRFLAYAETKGINMAEVVYAPHSYVREILQGLFKIRPGLETEDFEFVLAGYFADDCIKETAADLRVAGFRPYLLFGTSTIRGLGVKRERLEEIYGTDRVITLRDLKNLS